MRSIVPYQFRSFLTLTLAGLAATLAMSAPASATDHSRGQSCEGGFAEKFVLAGQVMHRKVFTAETLQTYATAKQNVAYFSGASGLVQKSYIGVPLIDRKSTRLNSSH